MTPRRRDHRGRFLPTCDAVQLTLPAVCDRCANLGAVPRHLARGARWMPCPACRTAPATRSGTLRAHP